jgi:hypothetical protein
MDDRSVEIEFWRNFRKCTGELTWRPATPDDLPAIRRLRNVTERFLGRQQKDPSLFAPPVILALVAENKTGKIIDLIYAEVQVEIVKMSCTRQGYKESFALADDLSAFLRKRGFKKVLVATSQRLKDTMAAGLEWAGFHCADGILSYWTRRI